MPGYDTHYLFGIKAYKKLPDSKIKEAIKKRKNAYILGVLGPDIFFYYATEVVAVRKNIGSVMHTQKTDTFLKNMADGVYLKELDVTTKPCSISRINNYTFRIILMQGLNRQIRRMCQESGYKVESLTRVRIMNIELGGLKIGEYRIIEGKEKTMLYESL